MTCEWNPKENRAAMSREEVHAQAVVSVGHRPNWHLCAECAELPAFKRFRVRRPLKVNDPIEVTAAEIKALQQFAKDKAAELRGKAKS